MANERRQHCHQGFCRRRASQCWLRSDKLRGEAYAVKREFLIGIDQIFRCRAERAAPSLASEQGDADLPVVALPLRLWPHLPCRLLQGDERSGFGQASDVHHDFGDFGDRRIDALGARRDEKR